MNYFVFCSWIAVSHYSPIRSVGSQISFQVKIKLSYRVVKTQSSTAFYLHISDISVHFLFYRRYAKIGNFIINSLQNDWLYMQARSSDDKSNRVAFHLEYSVRSVCKSDAVSFCSTRFDRAGFVKMHIQYEENCKHERLWGNGRVGLGLRVLQIVAVIQHGTRYNGIMGIDDRAVEYSGKMRY